jgi:hypothetical protein
MDGIGSKRRQNPQKRIYVCMRGHAPLGLGVVDGANVGLPVVGSEVGADVGEMCVPGQPIMDCMARRVGQGFGYQQVPLRTPFCII